MVANRETPCSYYCWCLGGVPLRLPFVCPDSDHLLLLLHPWLYPAQLPGEESRLPSHSVTVISTWRLIVIMHVSAVHTCNIVWLWWNNTLTDNNDTLFSIYDTCGPMAIPNHIMNLLRPVFSLFLLPVSRASTHVPRDQFYTNICHLHVHVQQHQYGAWSSAENHFHWGIWCCDIFKHPSLHPPPPSPALSSYLSILCYVTLYPG
jgi:hypothetical protein